MTEQLKDKSGVLSVNLSPEFTPAVPSFKAEGSFPQTIMYWVVGEDGKEKTYLNATPKEVLNWGKSILPEDAPQTIKLIVDSFNEDSLILENHKAYFLGIILEALVKTSRNNHLFGKPQQWEKLKEWQRLKKGEALTRKKDSENK